MLPVKTRGYAKGPPSLSVLTTPLDGLVGISSGFWNVDTNRQLFWIIIGSVGRSLEYWKVSAAGFHEFPCKWLRPTSVGREPLRRSPAMALRVNIHMWLRGEGDVRCLRLRVLLSQLKSLLSAVALTRV